MLIIAYFRKSATIFRFLQFLTIYGIVDKETILPSRMTNRL